MGAEGHRLTTKITNYVTSHGLTISGKPKDYTNLEQLSNQKVLADLKKIAEEKGKKYDNRIGMLSRIGAFDNLSDPEKGDLYNMTYVELGVFDANLSILRHLSETIDQIEKNESELQQWMRTYSYISQDGKPDFDRLVDDYSKSSSYSDLIPLITVWKASGSEEARIGLVLRLHQIIMVERVPPPPKPVPPAPWEVNPERFINPTEATAMEGFIRDNGLEEFYAGRAIEQSYLEVRPGMPREQYDMLLKRLNAEIVARRHAAESLPSPPPPPAPTHTDYKSVYDEGPDNPEDIDPLDVLIPEFNKLVNPPLETATPKEPQQPPKTKPAESLGRKEVSAVTPAPQKPVLSADDAIASTNSAKSMEELAALAYHYTANKDSVELRKAVVSKIRSLLPDFPRAEDRLKGSPLDTVLTAFDAAVYMSPSKLESRERVSFTASLDNLLRQEEGDGGTGKKPLRRGKSS